MARSADEKMTTCGRENVLGGMPGNVRCSNSANRSAIMVRWLSYSGLLGALRGILLIAVFSQSPARAEAVEPFNKQSSVFYPASLTSTARSNADRFPWAAQIRNDVVAMAQPWMKYSDDELWRFMFGPRIKRSWMVWSNGHCPACRKDVPMYTWKIDALARPWKVQCPHCQEFFPKNDFGRFHESGLDEQGIFDPGRADRSLLFNAEHPAADDPLRGYGVDDGEGYVDGDKRWRFIGAYLIYGQWKQAVVAGARNLAAAYVVTGDKHYAHKAGILLDRVADLYPTFDFGKQGVLYEGPPSSGYISTWHDACIEVRELMLAYDQVFAALREDTDLVTFLSGKAAKFKLDNRKTSFADIQRNIEDRIGRDTLDNRPKIESNYPTTDMTITLIKTVMGWPGNRDEVIGLIDAMLTQATAVDGLSGEKGLTGYSVIAPHSMADLLGRYARIDPTFLPETLRRHPRLRNMYRFHIDTWCLEKYYPLIGDCGGFALPVPRYVGLNFSNNPGVGPSSFSLAWALYEATKDPDFARVMFKANNNSAEGLPFDLFATDPEQIQEQVARIIRQVGADIPLGSINKTQWHLAILRSGSGKHARALWLDYDSGERHGHRDGMNLGLFARGLDLMPDFGYPPVQFGGWGSLRALWYTMSAAHNTVVVDSQNSVPAAGKTTLWANGDRFRAVRASGPNLIGGRQFERTTVSVDVSEGDFYVVDIFRVAGGTDHAKFMHSTYGRITTRGLSLKPGDDYGRNTQMRAFKTDPSPSPGWSVDWAIEEKPGMPIASPGLHLRYTDFTANAQASICEGWVVSGMFNDTQEAWIPRVMTRRTAKDATLASTFVSTIEPYTDQPLIKRATRLAVTTDPDSEHEVALRIELANGQTDLLIAPNTESQPGTGMPVRHIVQLAPGRAVESDAHLCWIRHDSANRLQRMAVCRGSTLSFATATLKLRTETEYLEIAFEDDKPKVVHGPAEAIADIQIDKRSIWPP